MHTPRRWPLVLCVALCALGLVLLLSLLVETTGDAAQPAQDTRPVVDALLLPAVLPAAETAPAVRDQNEPFWFAAFWALLAPVLPLLVRGTDANGRVLRKRRYARSYYPLFRQDLACG